LAGLDLPGTAPAPIVDRTSEIIRIALGLAFTIGGIGGILLIVRRRPPLSMA
jgi:hypothetical protein